jgi:hypothetical protein
VIDRLVHRGFADRLRPLPRRQRPLALGRLFMVFPIWSRAEGTLTRDVSAVPVSGDSRYFSQRALALTRRERSLGDLTLQISLETPIVGLKPTEWCRRGDWQLCSTPVRRRKFLVTASADCIAEIRKFGPDRLITVGIRIPAGSKPRT